MFYRHSILGTLDFTGSRHWALSIFLRAQPWICMHMCTLYICFLIWETIIWADEKRKYYMYIYTVCIFFLYKNKQTNRHTKKKQQNNNNNYKDMYTNCNRETQQCSQKGSFKLQTRKYSCNHWILRDGVCVINLFSPCFSILCLSFCQCFMDRFFFTIFLSFR